MSLLDPDTMPHLIDIRHIGYTQGDQGDDYEQTPDDDPFAEDEPCWIQQATARDITEYGKRNQVVTHVVYLTRDLGIKLTDVIDVKSGPYTGFRLEIHESRECTSGLLGLDGRQGAWRLAVEMNREASTPAG